MKQRISIRIFLISLVLCAAISAYFTQRLMVTEASSEAVYLIGAVTITDPDRLPEYQAIAGPLANKLGGYQPLAFADPIMIEGLEPTEDLYFIERYDSSEALQSFVNSPEFNQARKLRDQVASVRYMMWLPALSHDALPH